MFRHILTSTDGSDWAGKGVTTAIELAAALGARLTVLHVSEFQPAYLGEGGYAAVVDADRFREAANARAAEIFASAAEEAGKQGVTPQTVHVTEGPPAIAITHQAQELGCDLIVIGSRGRRGLTKLFLGSQAAEVLANTHLPVMIVK